MEVKIKNNLKNLKITLKVLRKSNNMTQKQVAERLGITHQSYQAYEAGIAYPTLENFIKLCHVFDVTPDNLLDFDKY